MRAPCFGELYIQRKFLDRSESTTKQASNIELLPPGGPVIIKMKGFRDSIQWGGVPEVAAAQMFRASICL